MTPEAQKRMISNQLRCPRDQDIVEHKQNPTDSHWTRQEFISSEISQAVSSPRGETETPLPGSACGSDCQNGKAQFPIGAGVRKGERSDQHLWALVNRLLLNA